MKVLSIDVGIKNLAFCLMEKLESTSDYKILMWDIIDLSQREKLKCYETNIRIKVELSTMFLEF